MVKVDYQNLAVAAEQASGTKNVVVATYGQDSEKTTKSSTAEADTEVPTPLKQPVMKSGDNYFPVNFTIDAGGGDAGSGAPALSEDARRRMATYIAGGVLLLLIVVLFFASRKSAA